MSSLSEDFHKAVHYGKKILNAREHISLTDEKITDVNKVVEEEKEQWHDLSQAENAYEIYNLMLNGDGKSSLKAIVSQCLASILRWKISVIPSELSQEKMFDLDLYSLKRDEKKRLELKTEIESDEF